MKAERGRRAKVVVGVIIATLALALVIAFEVERRSTVDVEVALAQPFLQLDTEAKLTKDYGAVFPDGLGTDMCAVYVTYETDDANAVVEQVKSACAVKAGMKRTTPEPCGQVALATATTGGQEFR